MSSLNDKIYIVELNERLMYSTASISKSQAKIDYQEYLQNKKGDVKKVRLLEYIWNDVKATTDSLEASNEDLKLDHVKFVKPPTQAY